MILPRYEIEKIIKMLIKKYNADYALLFGSYARGDATPESDIDIVVYGGGNFLPKDIFSLAEELREMTNHNADVFEINELNQDSDFYKNIIEEGIIIKSD